MLILNYFAFRFIVYSRCHEISISRHRRNTPEYTLVTNCISLILFITSNNCREDLYIALFRTSFMHMSTSSRIINIYIFFKSSRLCIRRSFQILHERWLPSYMRVSPFYSISTTALLHKDLSP